ncbi:MAG TPA: PGPGW domain-containing protein [Actinomycetota bacterium]|nr:PGPGW domain-containing protein [Actinomycetota bacterium]
MGRQDTQQINLDRTTELPRTVAVKGTRRLVVLIVGSTLITLGMFLIPFPGPFTIPLVLLGLTVLSWEFSWAKRLLFKVRLKMRELRAKSHYKH